ncbi:hypothetical protein LMG26411_03869 [Cupriavidus numazuensis]|uniref:DUF2474 domain-containing protein n=1 Tax=Cupriavidus numazuensis TaxID=221992 RepID=A0ABM8TJZ0_9BURK|nr:hypothetical protein LMG26411_03869 [Cupriavidus numazuensis]
MMPRPVRLPLWLRRVGWLVLIWAASVAALGAAAWLLRLLMAGAGFHR